MEVAAYLKSAKRKQGELELLDAKIYEAQKKLNRLVLECDDVEVDLKLKRDVADKDIKLRQSQMGEAFAKKESDFKKQITELQDKMDKMQLNHREDIAKLVEKHKVEKENDAITLKLAHQKELADEVQKVTTAFNEKYKSLLDSNYATLSDSLKKLHEEGNAQTKFVQTLASDMLATKFNKNEQRTITMND